ncbi:MAG: ATP-binding protein [Deltaproteobacteria bacterium]|nr:MAG: ATP-binding protein [Deltaproteobacteria bacterium]
MVARAHAATILGVEARLVTVEADVGMGLPCLTVVGQASGAVSETRERVRAALAHSGHAVPPRRQVVNLAPADLRKDDAGLDLAVAVALLSAHGIVPEARAAEAFFWGELALDGRLRPAAGTLVAADHARGSGFATFVTAPGAAAEAALVTGLDVREAETLADVVAFLRGETDLPTAHPAKDGDATADLPDLGDVRGLRLPRLALEVMVAGGHNLLFVGPPGVGKTMLARRAVSLYPPLDDAAAMEVTKIHGVALGRTASSLVRRVPFRAPHHTVSPAGLLGGGTPPRPGEVSLAHRGILFLDELLEYSRACLEGMREPLEEGVVAVVRARYSLRFPARFQLLAAMNPCPCGYDGHPLRACTCSRQAVDRYRARLSGPLVDRIDLIVPVHPPADGRTMAAPAGDDSATVRERVVRARTMQAARLGPHRIRCNAQVPAEGRLLAEVCRTTPQARRLLDRIVESRHMSLRAAGRLLRVARTVADLRGPDDPWAPIEEVHVAEAAQLRRAVAVRPEGPRGPAATADASSAATRRRVASTSAF